MSLLDRLEAIRQEDKQELLNLLRDGCNVWQTFSGAELYGRVAAIAAYLQRNHSTAKRIGLIYPSGGFLIAPVILGCICAGCLVAPMKIPKPRRKSDRASSVLIDAELDLVIIPTEFANGFQEFAVAQGRDLVCLLHEDLMRLPTFALAAAPMPAPDDVVVLQFTSGSTNTPKGVELSLRMIEKNCHALAKALKIHSSSRLYNWMPFFHDFGLIFGTFLPVFLGCRVCSVDPMVFVQDPMSCFRGLDRNAITHTAFASFALEHSVLHADAAALDGLDLSRLQQLLVGADLIRPAHAEAFLSVFSPCGFSADALVAGYGLAEATLAVSVSQGGVQSRPVTDKAWQKVLPDQEVLECGKPVDGVTVRIHALDGSHRCLDEDEIGEILVSGPSVIGQYRGQPPGTACVLKDDVPYFPTGDIGFLHHDALYVCGRVKELLIVNGENFAPTLIEDICLERLGLKLASYRACAFVFSERGMDRLGLAIEVPSDMRNSFEVVAWLKEAVFAATDLALERVEFFRIGNLPKTSSGKLMRRHIAAEQNMAGTGSSETEATRTADILGVTFEPSLTKRHEIKS